MDSGAVSDPKIKNLLINQFFSNETRRFDFFSLLVEGIDGLIEIFLVGGDSVGSSLCAEVFHFPGQTSFG